MSLIHILETFKETELREQNLRAQFVDLRRDLTGEIRLGTTEGRFRILMPDIMSEFKKNFPDVKLLISSAASPELRKMVQNNQLDLMVANIPPEDTEKLDHVTVLEENLYLEMCIRDSSGRSAQNRPALKHSHIVLFIAEPQGAAQAA